MVPNESPAKSINSNAPEKSNDFIAPLNPDSENTVQKGKVNICDQAMKVMRNVQFTMVTLAISVMFWITTGLMYWFSDYMQIALKMPVKQVNVAYSIIVISGPIVGVLLGGHVINKIGGYNNVLALYTTILMGLFCMAVSVPIGFVDDGVTVEVLLWFTLFAGGFVLPTMTGMMINTVPVE